MSTITAAQFRQMSAKDLHETGFFVLEDAHNLTNGDMELLRQRLQEYDRATPLDADLLNQKLANIEESHSITREPTPVWNLEEARPRLEELEYESYDSLIADGGIPTHHPSTTREQLYAVANNGVIQYWRTEHCSDTVHYTLKSQARAWKDFRAEQDRNRNDKTMTFAEYEGDVKRRRLEWQLTGDVDLKRVRQEQTQLDDFKEWQYLEHNQRNYYKSMIERMAKRDSTVWDRVRQSRLDGGNILSSFNRVSLLTGWIDEQVARLEEERASGAINGTGSLGAAHARVMEKRQISDNEEADGPETVDSQGNLGRDNQLNKRARVGDAQPFSSEANKFRAQRLTQDQRTGTDAPAIPVTETASDVLANIAVKINPTNQKRKRARNDTLFKTR